MEKKRIVVTGGSGKAGRACVDDLLARGYDVFVVDRVLPSPRARNCRVTQLPFW